MRPTTLTTTPSRHRIYAKLHIHIPVIKAIPRCIGLLFVCDVDLPEPRRDASTPRSTRDEVCGSYLDMSVLQSTMSDEMVSRHAAMPAAAAAETETAGECLTQRSHFGFVRVVSCISCNTLYVVRAAFIHLRLWTVSNVHSTLFCSVRRLGFLVACV